MFPGATFYLNSRRSRSQMAVSSPLAAVYRTISAPSSDVCRKTVQTLAKEYDTDDTPHLILAASLARDKHINKAADYLKARVSEHPGCSIEVKLTLAQLFLQHGSVYPACNVLKSMGDISYKPGLVATLVKLYMSQEDIESASQVLNDAVNFYKQNNPSSPDVLTLVRANANFQYKHGNPQQAVTMLEQLRKREPRDPRILAQLICAYSKFDQAKARAVSNDLPSVHDLASDVDVAYLEASLNSFSNRYIKKSNKQPQHDASPKSPKPEEEMLDKRKKKKKKKSKAPQNVDAPVDPERWLPRRERSYYRGKRKDKRKDIGKGTQGAAAASGDGAGPDPSKAASPPASDVGSPRPGSSTTQQTAPQAAGPRQQKSQQASKKKKKKGNKW